MVEIDDGSTAKLDRSLDPTGLQKCTMLSTSIPIRVSFVMSSKLSPSLPTRSTARMAPWDLPNLEILAMLLIGHWVQAKD